MRGKSPDSLRMDEIRVSMFQRWIRKNWFLLGFLAGCSSMPTEDQKLACGQQCLRNGENCSQFFARKNEERRLDFEQAKQNYWMCMRRYPSARNASDTPCIAPAPNTVKYDSCGQELDECMAACKTTLDEVARYAGKQSPAGGDGAGAASLPPSDEVPREVPVEPVGNP